ncbi:MAG: TolC family protein [Bacteroidales bacterium]|nr:TolC family protein [Bacteroidales bacterium]
MISKKIIITLSFLLVSITAVYAQQASYNLEYPSQRLSLEECRQMATQNNIEKSIAKEQINVAAHKVAAYKTNYLPKISATGLYLYSNATLAKTIEGGMLPTFVPDGAGGVAPNGGFAFMPDIPLELSLNSTYNGALRIEQPIYTGGKVTAAYKMAQTGYQMAQVNQELSQYEVILLCDQAYWNCVKAKAIIETTRQIKETLIELERMVKNAVEEGMTHRKELLTVQVKMNEANLNLTRAQNGYNLAIMNLNHITGIPLNSSTEVTDSFETQGNIAAEQSGLDIIESTFDITLRPEYRLLSKQVEMKKLQENLVRSEFLPNVGVMGAYGYTNGLKMNNEKLLDGANFAALLSINIPIFHWGEGKNKIKEAKLESSIAQMQLNNSQQKMTLEATKAINQLNEAKLEVALTTKSVEQAKENMEVSKERYSAGMETLANYMEAQTMWQNAISNYITAKASLNLTKTKYLKATGKL